MESPLVIAVAQTTPVRGDVAANVAQHIRLAREAAAEGARLVLFPELSLTGYELDLACELAFAVDDGRLEPLRGVAQECAVTLVAGAPVQLGERLHIGAFVLSPDGGVDVATKRHLGAFPPDVNPGGAVPPGEPSIFETGDRDPLVPVGDQTAAIAICADANRPETAERAATRGARVLLASVFVTPGEVDRDHARLRGYAERHGLLVAMANHGAPTGGLVAGGRSAIWAPGGALVGELAPTGAGVLVADRSEPGWGVVGRMPDS